MKQEKIKKETENGKVINSLEDEISILNQERENLQKEKDKIASSFSISVNEITKEKEKIENSLNRNLIK